MIVSVDVYTKNLEAALSAFKTAIESGATDVTLSSNENWETKEFENLNLTFNAEHSSKAISELDNGSFNIDPDNL